ncbi:MAG: serine/threonine protein kinase, partial [Deltaproteobacteria bacterium]|nr:serine/threonine protein kinase [Deltaproteobacteria bacterium]
MRSVCPACSRDFEAGEQVCPDDGAKLLLVQPGRAAQLVGTDLDGRFRIDRLLGEGGMGAVYVGTQVSVGREVAIKVIHPDQIADAETVRRFHREAQVISRLAHSHTVHLVDFGQTSQGLLYLVMELVKGRSLSHDLAKGPLPPPRVSAIVGQICDALAEAHAQGIVHRDLKPDNVLLTTQAGADDFVKILDFGIAKVAGQDERALSTLTEAGAIVGTPQYMSPEQIDARTDVTGSSDLYSLTVMVFEMLSGQLPFHDSSPMSLLIKHLKDEPPRLSQVAPNLAVAAAIEPFLARNLSKTPAGRSPDAQSYKTELQKILGGAAGVRPNRPVPQRPDRQMPTDVKPTVAMQRSTGPLAEGAAASPATVAYRPEPVAVPAAVAPEPLPAAKPSRGPMVALAAAGVGLVAVGAAAALWYARGQAPAQAPVAPAAAPAVAGPVAAPAAPEPAAVPAVPPPAPAAPAPAAPVPHAPAAIQPQAVAAAARPPAAAPVAPAPAA